MLDLLEAAVFIPFLATVARLNLIGGFSTYALKLKQNAEGGNIQ